MSYSDDFNWMDIFPFDSPYPKQKDGINRAIENGRDNGFLTIEGACGTGKTLLALTAGLTLQRDQGTDYSRVVVATSLRQQMRAFEDDLKAINSHLKNSPGSPPPVTAVSLVGKQDVCPYSTGGAFSDGEVYSRCNPLKESTSDIVFVDDSEADSPYSEPVRNAMQLVSDAHEQTIEPTVLDSATSPFADRPLEYRGSSYCPYYAQYLADDIADESSIPTDNRVLTRDRLMTDAVDYGTCPHTTMRDAMYDADVVLANYQHIFSQQIVDTFSGPLVDDGTYLIIDEAHTLLQRVREELSNNTTHTALVNADDECRDVLNWLNSSNSEYRDRARQIVKNSETTESEIERFQQFLDELSDRVAAEARDTLADAYPSDSAPYYDIDDTASPLEDEDISASDTLTTWGIENGYPPAFWEQTEKIGETIATVKSTVKREVENKTGRGVKFAEAAGAFLSEWARRDNTYYFRELRVVDRGISNDDFTGWKSTVRAELWLNNLIPASELANRFDDFGGGILMSATLAPMDIYVRNTGLTYLTDRPVDTELYELPFPEQNRTSLAVDLPPFTYENRKDPFDPPQDPESAADAAAVRNSYLDTMAIVCRTTPGNVLLYFPSYKEASWAAEELADRVDKTVLCDESSGNLETEKLKREFFDGSGKVLTTSLRGTLTEGVDFSGDRLAAAVVVGVPILPFNSPKQTALLNAYEEEYGYTNGFDYAYTVPAVRKSRQALGRVIRGTEDVGVRLLFDRRYTEHADEQRSVRPHLPDTVAEEYQTIDPQSLSTELTQFWGQR